MKAGIGICGTVLIGICLFGDSASMARLLFLLSFISAIIGLKLVS